MSFGVPEVVRQDGDLVVMHAVRADESVMTIFSQNRVHDLAKALVTIQVTAQGAKEVRYLPAADKELAHILVVYGQQLSEDDYAFYADAFVYAIKKLG